jgi:hypothetical protein
MLRPLPVCAKGGLQTFAAFYTKVCCAAVHASVHNHFNVERPLYSRANFKINRSAALSEWRKLCSA